MNNQHTPTFINKLFQLGPRIIIHLGNSHSWDASISPRQTSDQTKTSLPFARTFVMFALKITNCRSCQTKCVKYRSVR